MKIGVSAEIPQGRDDAPYVEATMIVLLETSPEKISAEVLKSRSRQEVTATNARRRPRDPAAMPSLTEQRLATR